LRAVLRSFPRPLLIMGLDPVYPYYSTIGNKLKRIKIDPAIINASGIFSTVPVLNRRSGCFGGDVTKTFTYEKRPGNQTPSYTQCSNETSINAVGLSGTGYDGI